MKSSDSIEATAFATMRLAPPILRALEAKGYTHASPIQAAAIPKALEGLDVTGCAQTGTGKTAAFALPILHTLQARRPKPGARGPRALVLAPTRELATQIGKSFADYGQFLRLTHMTVFGGVSEIPQIRALQRGVDIIVATPGRLLDLMRSRYLNLDTIEFFVLDEADRMLDMGFAPDVKKIITALPKERQSMLFSATMPGPIREIAEALLQDPVSVEVTPVASTVDRIDQRVCMVPKAEKQRFLTNIVSDRQRDLTLIFARTKHGASRVAENLTKSGIPATVIHGNKSQAARQRALEEFRTGRVRVLVATDIAARGIDVKGITLVVNFDIPVEAESYVHRIGRTARAGAEGIALSLCDPSERGFLRSIESLIRKRIPVLSPDGRGNLSLNALPPAERDQRPLPPRTGHAAIGEHRPVHHAQGERAPRANRDNRDFRNDDRRERPERTERTDDSGQRPRRSGLAPLPKGFRSGKPLRPSAVEPSPTNWVPADRRNKRKGKPTFGFRPPTAPAWNAEGGERGERPPRPEGERTEAPRSDRPAWGDRRNSGPRDATPRGRGPRDGAPQRDNPRRSDSQPGGPRRSENPRRPDGPAFSEQRERPSGQRPGGNRPSAGPRSGGPNRSSDNRPPGGRPAGRRNGPGKRFR